MSIIRINEFKSAEGKTEALHAFLLSLIPYISNSKGCIFCELLQEEDDTSNFVVIEKWESKADHTLSIQQFPREQMEAAIPLFGAPPKGRYFTE